MTGLRPTLRLYLANRSWSIGTPLLILGLMTLISVIIAAIIGIRTGFPIPPEIRHEMGSNGGAIFSVPGFLIALGALVMNRNFSMALAFGSTRRQFWMGSSAGFVGTALAVAALSLLALGLERLTGGWFIGARAFDVAALGEGDPLRTAATMFVVALGSLYLGALFGTVHRAFGAVWTTVTAIGLAVVLLAVVAIIVWQWPTLSTWQLGVWHVLGLCSVLVAIAAAASYAVNRRATV